jgi:hypothetical protein
MIAELKQREGGLVSCFADLACCADSDVESKMQQLRQLGRRAADSDCMSGAHIVEPQQNYASKLLLAAVDDMRAAMPAALHAQNAS